MDREINKPKYKKIQLSWKVLKVKSLIIKRAKIVCIQGVMLPDQQTLRGISRHEDKHYLNRKLWGANVFCRS